MQEPLRTSESFQIFVDNDEETMARVTVDGKKIIIDKRDEGLIINDECKKIMRNLCSEQPRQAFQSGVTGITQPSFLSQEDRILYFKTKMFYLLQERHSFMEQQLQVIKQPELAPAEAYPTSLSPFCNFTGTTEQQSTGLTVGRLLRQPTEVRMEADKTKLGNAAELGLVAKGKALATPAQNTQKTGMIKFLEHIQKADQSVLHMLDGKILKTMEGTGFATLFCSDKGMKKVDVIQALFPDYNLLLLDGKDEESRLNNLVSHVRNRLKVFDKLQAYYENPNREDHTAHVFTVPNWDVAVVRDELATLRPKRLDQLDEKKLAKLYHMFRDDYGSAKTTLIADGTQPVVLNRKKLERVKKHVDECNEWKGTMLIPYVQETNFFFLMFPWLKGQEQQTKP